MGGESQQPLQDGVQLHGVSTCWAQVLEARRSAAAAVAAQSALRDSMVRAYRARAKGPPGGGTRLGALAGRASAEGGAALMLHCVRSFHAPAGMVLLPTA